MSQLKGTHLSTMENPGVYTKIIETDRLLTREYQPTAYNVYNPDHIVEQLTGKKNSGNSIVMVSDKGTGELKHPVLDNPRVGSALKDDFYHNFNDIIDNYAVDAQRFDLPNKKGHMDSLYQIEGSVVKYETKYVKVKNNAPEMLQTKETIDGVFEWVVDPTTNTVTHRTFIPGGKVTGKINQWGK